MTMTADRRGAPGAVALVVIVTIAAAVGVVIMRITFVIRWR